jgi:predicted nucleic acid-binding protein
VATERKGAEATQEPLVCDANVVAKWFLEEEWSDTARTLLTSRRPILSPDLMVAELGSIFRQKVLAGLMAIGDTRPALDVVLDRVTFVPSTETFVHAIAVAVSTGRSFYDCLYLSLALTLGCRFLTADERFINAVRSRFDQTLLWLGDLSEDV